MSQVVYLTGVLDDGTPLDPSLPRNTATTVQISQHMTARFDLRVFYASGVAVDVGALASWSAVLAVRRSLDPCQVVPDLVIAGELPGALEGKNLIRFPLVPRDTRKLALGRYLFDVTLVSGVLRWQVVRTSALILQPGLARVV
jgi:hypothetical protein